MLVGNLLNKELLTGDIQSNLILNHLIDIDTEGNESGYLHYDNSTNKVSVAQINQVVIDSEMSDLSTNTVQNKIIKAYADTKIPKMVGATSDDIATLSSSGGITDSNVMLSDLQFSFNAKSLWLEDTIGTTLSEFYNYMCDHPDNTFSINLGSGNVNNFKSIVGVPTGFGNYTECAVKRVTTCQRIGVNPIFEVVAIGLYISKFAIGYIYNDHTNIRFTGWKTL